MNTPDWRKPTREEAAKGYIAMERQTFYCQAPDRAWDNTGHVLKAVHVDSKGNAAWFGYTAQRIERRIARGGSLPAWIEVRQAKEAA